MEVVRSKHVAPRTPSLPETCGCHLRRAGPHFVNARDIPGDVVPTLGGAFDESDQVVVASVWRVREGDDVG